MSEQSTLAMGDVASVQSLRLPWKRLESMFGKLHLEARVREAGGRADPAMLGERELSALVLAAKYAEGWRPKDDFGEEEGAEAETVSGVSEEDAVEAAEG